MVALLVNLSNSDIKPFRKLNRPAMKQSYSSWRGYTLLTPTRTTWKEQYCNSSLQNGFTNLRSGNNSHFDSTTISQSHNNFFPVFFRALYSLPYNQWPALPYTQQLRSSIRNPELKVARLAETGPGID